MSVVINVLNIFFFVLLLISAVGLLFFILIQNDQGDGFGSAFGGSSNASMGVAAPSPLAKITTRLAIVFIVSVLATAFFSSREREPDQVLQEIQESGQPLWWEEDNLSNDGSATTQTITDELKNGGDSNSTEALPAPQVTEVTKVIPAEVITDTATEAESLPASKE